MSHFGYIIDCEGSVAIIDPLRDVTDYTKYLKNTKGKLRYILETHYHADFVSGFLDLAK